jgi:signal transduction histidine kinase
MRVDLGVSQSADPRRGGSALRAMTAGPPGVSVEPVQRLLQRLRRLWPDPVVVDRVFALVLLVWLPLETWLSNEAAGHQVQATVVGMLTAAGVAVRRRYPTAVGVGAALVAVIAAAFWPSTTVAWGVAWIACMYALAVWSRRFWLGLAVYVAAGLAALPVDPSWTGSVFFIVVSSIVLVLVHSVVRDRERRAQLAERERDLAAREAVVEERARIARELHDAIAHSVSLIVIQAGAERRVLDEGDSTREVLETIEHTGREALTEMRRLVGMLRTDAGEPLAPQPALDDLPRLLEQVRASGLAVELHVEGDRRELPVGVELSAYRIVQEALTNALKHADGTQAVVHVRYGPDALELEIVDDGAASATSAAGGGHGLVGMRERVALYGGRLDAGRRAAGGYGVRVLLPIR